MRGKLFISWAQYIRAWYKTLNVHVFHDLFIRWSWKNHFASYTCTDIRTNAYLSSNSQIKADLWAFRSIRRIVHRRILLACTFIIVAAIIVAWCWKEKKIYDISDNYQFLHISQKASVYLIKLVRISTDEG